jgi:periplasmic divalent cation tolerance protein
MAHDKDREKDTDRDRSGGREKSARNAGVSKGESRPNEVLVGLVTAPPDDAGRIAGVLVERGLAACCNVVSPVTSIFTWKGARETEIEALLVIKTIRAKSGELTDCVREIHPYDLPEVIFLPVAAGLEDYLNWVRDECGLKESAE